MNNRKKPKYKNGANYKENIFMLIDKDRKRNILVNKPRIIQQ